MFEYTKILWIYKPGKIQTLFVICLIFQLDGLWNVHTVHHHQAVRSFAIKSWFRDIIFNSSSMQRSVVPVAKHRIWRTSSDAPPFSWFDTFQATMSEDMHQFECKAGFSVQLAILIRTYRICSIQRVKRISFWQLKFRTWFTSVACFLLRIEWRIS